MFNRKQLLERQVLMYLFFFFVAIFSLKAVNPVGITENQIQSKIKIEGVVVDEKGEPIIGAGVLIKGTASGVATDFDGKFTINVAEGETLLISSLGYNSKEVVVGKNTTLRIDLKPNSVLMEGVQVIAYGSQSKLSVTGAMSSVKTKDLVKVPNASITNALAGVMPGVSSVQTIGQPGMEDAKIYIRGSSTLGGGNDSPLVLVDGVERSFSQIDPNEIADITILKDASSTAVFGVRGANGVILVTTRRGKEGKARISVSSNVSMQMPTVLVKNCNSYETAMLYNEKLDNDGSSAARFSDYALDAFQTGAEPMIYPDTDWRNLMFKKAYMQTQHNFNVSGGTDKVRYFASIGYLFQDGLLKKFSKLDYDNRFFYHRFNYRANLDIDLTPTTLFKVNVGGIYGDRHEPIGHGDGLWRQINWSLPFAAPAELSEDGHPFLVGNSYMPIPLKNGWSAFYGRGYTNLKSNKLDLDLEIEQKLDFITKGLKCHIKGAYNSSFKQLVKRQGARQTYQLYYKGTVDGVDMSDPSFDKTVVYKVQGADKYLKYNENFNKARDWYLEAAVNYKRKFARKHKVSGLLLYNQSRNYYPSTYAYIPRSYAGLVVRGTYNYDDKYLCDINVGYNGSENFASGKNRYGVFPSGSIGWVISEEKFMKKQDVISFLKVRASYGLVGNDKISSSRFLYMPGVWNVDNNGYNFGTSISTNEPAANEGKKGNREVTWEKARKHNYGIDIRFLNSRLKFTADVFKERRYDILIVRNSAPDVLAMNLPQLNMGEVENKGYELSLNWNDSIGDFMYYSKANVSYAKNKIIYMDEVDHKNSFNYKTGQSTGKTYGYEFIRFYQESDFDNNGNLLEDLPTPTFGTPHPGDCMYADKDGDGVINTDDMSYLGYSTRRPEYTFGLTLGASYHGFDFSMLWTGATNVSRLLSTEYRVPFSPSGKRALFKYHADNRWTPETAETATLPRFTNTNKNLDYTPNSSLWVKDASYIRLKNMQISYTFSKKSWIEKLGMRNLNVYLSGYNLLTFDHIKFIDPEAPTDGGKSNQYPISRIVTAGVKMNF